MELEKYLKQYERRGVKIIVCPIDRLPAKIEKNQTYAFVINLSKSWDIGSHWIGLFIDAEGKVSYFDSYGFKPKSYYLEDFLKGKRVEYCTRQLQQLGSAVCGMYVACFIIHMLKGGSLDLFVSKFSKNLVLNDIFIRKNYNYYHRN